MQLWVRWLHIGQYVDSDWIACLNRMQRIIIPEITGAHIFFPSEDTLIMPTTNYHTKKTKTVRESRGGLAAPLNYTNSVTHSRSRLIHLRSISLRTWWLLCKGKKVTYFAWAWKERESFLNLLHPLVSLNHMFLWTFHSETRELLAFTSCSGLFTTLTLSPITYKAIKR